MNTKTKYIISLAGFIASVSFFGTPQIAHAAWPVIDVSSIAKLSQQLQEMQKQYDMMKQQYAELQATKDAVTGSYGVSMIANGSSDQLGRRTMPGTWQEVVSLQKSGAIPGLYGKQQDYFQKLLPSVDTKLFSENPKSRNSVSYKMSTDNTQAAFAATEAVYNKIQDRLQTIEALTAEIDKTQNVKNATDLNSRIVAENGFLTVDMARLNSMQLSLQTTMQNNQNQATANHAEFFGTPMK